jgi:hypothetical protein
MNTNTDADIRHIYDRWHESIRVSDVDGLVELYSADAVFESPLVMVVYRDRPNGILRGTSELRAFFATGGRNLQNSFGRWYRTNTFFSNGQQLVWEYPRETPQGDQVDLIEMMDIANGLIAHHRVYWGWVGFQSLVAAMNT